MKKKLIFFYFTGVVKKAVGAILKIAHGEPLAIEAAIGPEANGSSGDGEQQQPLTTSKFNLLDPLKVSEIFQQIDLKV